MDLCRKTAGCNAWFWCKEEGGCLEPLSEAAVQHHQCMQLDVALLPLPLPPLPPLEGSALHSSSFAAGFIIDDGTCGVETLPECCPSHCHLLCFQHVSLCTI